MVRLCNADPENTNVFTVEFCANACPQASEITLRIGWIGSIPFGVTVACLCRGVIFRRCGQGVKLTNITELIADIFKPTNAGHKLTASNRRVSD